MTALVSSLRVPASASPRGGRLYYMDAARSILILLGVILHAANIYDPDGTWLVHDHGWWLLGWLSSLIHLFRMPAFFIISGFFCAYTLPKYTPAGFLRIRLLRLALPFVTVAATLNLAQVFVSQSIHRPGVEPLPAPLPAWFWLSSGWVYHLWFLLDLMIYFVVVYAVVATPAVHTALRRLADQVELRLRPRTVTWLAMIVLPALALVGLDVMAWLIPALSHPFGWLGDPVTFLYYAVFFVTGILLCRFHVLSTLLMRPSVGLMAMSAVLVAIVPWMAEPGAGLVAKAGARFGHALGVMLLCQWTLLFFKSVANRPSRVYRYLADASYSIYLLHHLCVVLLGIALLSVALPPAVKFIIVTAVTVVVTLVAHHYAVLRVPLLRLLLNGKRAEPGPRGRPAAASRARGLDRVAR